MVAGTQGRSAGCDARRRDVQSANIAIQRAMDAGDRAGSSRFSSVRVNLLAQLGCEVNAGRAGRANNRNFHHDGRGLYRSRMPGGPPRDLNCR